MRETPAGADLDIDRMKTKRFRFDTGSTRGADIAPGRGSLLRAFGAWGRLVAADEPDRRSAPRHNQLECLAWVGWKTFRQFHMNDALVVNISRGGALIFADAPPPTKKPVWVFLETPRLNTIVKARVLEVCSTAQGQCTIRVQFEEPCPYEVFETAVCGLAPNDPRMRAASGGRAYAGAPAPVRRLLIG